MKFLLYMALLAPLMANASVAPRLLAEIDGKPIYSSDLDGFKKPGESLESALDRFILFRLSVKEAERQNLAKNPEVKQAIDRVLYQAFVDNATGTHAKKTPSPKELRRAYQQQPMVRLRHLVLRAKTPAQKKVASEKIALIQKELKKGTSFKKLVLKHSQDQSARFAGDLDYRGVPNLPSPIYSAALALKQNEVSSPIKFDGAVHLVELIAVQSFNKIPATYRAYLTAKLKQETERAAVLSKLEKVRRNSKIKNYLKRPNNS